MGSLAAWGRQAVYQADAHKAALANTSPVRIAHRCEAFLHLHLGSCFTYPACDDDIVGAEGARQLGAGDDEEEEQADPGGQGRQGGRQEAHQERRHRRHSGRKPCISYAKE